MKEKETVIQTWVTGAVDMAIAAMYLFAAGLYTIPVMILLEFAEIDHSMGLVYAAGCLIFGPYQYAKYRAKTDRENAAKLISCK